ncbi:MAG: permease [Spirochaetaceae bacterium]|nr:MAG: permease [Spirochaetaceae bacterium]
MTTVLLYGLAAAALAVSAAKDRKKTMMALKKGWIAFARILPQFIAVILLVGIMIAVLRPVVLSRFLGRESGLLGVILASLVGAVTLIPGFIAFPTASLLLQNGAGLTQIAAFVSSLMMVGVVTFPVEASCLGTRAALVRNVTAYLFSLFVAVIIGLVVPI